MASPIETNNDTISYIAMRDGMVTMNSASIVRVTSTGSEEEYGSISMAKIRDIGAVTLSRQDGQEDKYDVKRRKSIKGFVVMPSESGTDDDDSVVPFARAWRDGLLSKRMKIIIGNTLFYLFNEGFLKYKFCIVKVGQVEDIMDDDAIDNMVRKQIDQKDKNGMKQLTIGNIEKDGLFKKTYSMKFDASIPALLPGLAMWFSIMFERQDAAGGAA